MRLNIEITKLPTPLYLFKKLTILVQFCFNIFGSKNNKKEENAKKILIRTRSLTRDRSPQKSGLLFPAKNRFKTGSPGIFKYPDGQHPSTPKNNETRFIQKCPIFIA